MKIERDRVTAAGIGVGVAVLVTVSLNYSGGYYALAAGITGSVVVVAATGALVLGNVPSVAALCAGATIVVLGAWSALSATWGGIPDAAWRSLCLALTAAAAVILGSALARRVRAVVAGVLAGITLHATIVLATVGSGSAAMDWFQVRQLEGSIGYHNAEGAICAVGVPLALWLAGSSSHWERAAGASAAALILAVALLTQSRGSLAAITLGVVVQIAVSRRARSAALAVALVIVAAVLFSTLQAVDRALVEGRPLDDPAFRRYAAVAFALAGALAVLSLVPLPPLVVKRRTAVALTAGAAVLAIVAIAATSITLLSRLPDRDRLTVEPNSLAGGNTRLSSLSTTGRAALWRVALRMTQDQPLLGNGTGSFPRRWSLERTNSLYVLQPHSLELEVLSETGLVGLSLLAAVLAGVSWCIVVSVRRDRAIGAAVAGALAAYLFFASVDWIQTFSAITVAALLVTGAAAGSRQGRVPGRLKTLGYLAAMLAALAVLAGPALAQYELDKARALAVTSPDRSWATAARARWWNRWSSEVVGFQALLAEQRGDFEVAARLYNRAASLDLQPWTNTYREARALRRAGLTDRAEAACRRSIASNPLEPELRLGVCQGTAGK